MNELSLINLLPSTRDQVTSFVRYCKSEIMSSDTPLENLVQLRTVLKAITELSSDEEIVRAALRQLDHLGADKCEINGIKVERCETGVKYDYSVCKDPEWESLVRKEEEIAIRRKARESILKIQRPPEVDAATGEIKIPYIPAVKTSKSNIKVTI